jgi:hypothetical protein
MMIFAKKLMAIFANFFQSDYLHYCIFVLLLLDLSCLSGVSFCSNGLLLGVGCRVSPVDGQVLLLLVVVGSWLSVVDC